MRISFVYLNDFIKISVQISIFDISDHLHFEKVSKSKWMLSVYECHFKLACR